ncbi:MAG: pseudouridine synthase [Chitinophagales bacterium]
MTNGSAGERPAGVVRLQKALAQAGVASRRAAEELILSGRVSVNGRIVRELGVKVDPGRDELALDGRPLAQPPRNEYLLLNKPAGVITTARDPQGRPTVLDLVDCPGVRLFPVGRLDADTEGLLLLTNDGELANLLLHPRYHVAKTYEAVVAGRVTGADLTRLERGVVLEDGPTAPARARCLASDGQTSTVELVIREGRKRQVKRMLAAVGHPVLHLRRTAFGPLRLGALAPGQWRRLSEQEVASLWENGRMRSHNFPDRRSD